MSSTLTTGQRLDPAEAEALWRRWRDRRDAPARDRLVLSYAPMVRYLAARKARELPAHCELEDLASCGLIALMEAVDRFDPTRRATFEQYAWTRVAGAIVDELRRQDWASRSVRRFGRRVERARDEWIAKHGAVPTGEQLAGALEMTAAELRAGLDEIDRADLVSLNAPAREGGEEAAPVEVGDTIVAPYGADEPERATLSAERAALLRSAVADLNERERKVLTLVHVHELQGAEIGRLLGVSESRVSQILAGIRRKLKDQVEAYDSAHVAA
jgi:RNA polymerase sigma factor for flagellar operon FliA